MKVLFISGSYPPIKCGVGDYTSILCDKLSKHIDISILTSKSANEHTNTDVKVINVVEKWKGIRLLKTINKELKKNKYDLVHIQFPTSEYVSNSIANRIFLPLMLRLKRVKLIYTFHEYPGGHNGMSKLVCKPAIRFSNKVIVVEEDFKNQIIRDNKLRNKEKVQVVHIGSNIPKSVASENEIIQLRNDILNTAPMNVNRIIAYFGFLNVAKRMDVILNAFAELKKEGVLSSMLLIIGEFNDKKCPIELFEQLKKIIIENDLQQFIHVTGYVETERVGDYLKLSDASVLLFNNGVSLRNGSMLAAQQEGIRVVTTKPSANQAYFSNEQFRLIDNNVEQLKGEIIDIQNSHTELHLISNQNSWENVVEKHLKIYSEVIKNDI